MDSITLADVFLAGLLPFVVRYMSFAKSEHMFEFAFPFFALLTSVPKKNVRKLARSNEHRIIANMGGRSGLLFLENCYYYNILHISFSLSLDESCDWIGMGEWMIDKRCNNTIEMIWYDLLATVAGFRYKLILYYMNGRACTLFYTFCNNSVFR